MNIANQRKEYGSRALDEKTVEKEPAAQFYKWFDEALAAQTGEANAMTLSTVSADGQPHGRVVLLKGLENGAFVFFTNYKSDKGLELEANNRASLTFFWAELERQVRIEGKVMKTSEEESAAYFQSRPLQSRLGAWASMQSSKIPNRQYLEDKMMEVTRQYEGTGSIPKPPHWGGYALTPQKVEFWQGRPGRLHDRILYEKTEAGWSIRRLSP